MNPVILLDEVDKLGADWRGDPSAALEVLDPAQNHAFRGSLSGCRTRSLPCVHHPAANVTDTIPGPLLDRMEVIRFDGYTTDEKVAIARGFVAAPGGRNDCAWTMTVDDSVLRNVITCYTREAGVRQLERELSTLLRKTATAISGMGRRRLSSIMQRCERRLAARKFITTAARWPRPVWLQVLR
jgi:ATP-dependent Lon protease